MNVAIHRSAERFKTETAWSKTWHSFAFGGYYDPDNTHFGLLLANNDEFVRPGPGYEPHPHRGIEIVSWVLDGVLRHEDSGGTVTETCCAQLLSAGTGITHAERSATDKAVHFVQMWLPAVESGPPCYQQADVVPTPDAFTSLASGSGDAPLGLRHPAARLSVGRGSFPVPAAPFVHLFVTRGSVTVECAGRLDEGDALRVTDGAALAVTGARSAEVLVWQMDADVLRPPT